MSDKGNIREIVHLVAMKKPELVSVLASFAATDTILYLGQLSDENVKKKAEQAIGCANGIMHTQFVATCSLGVEKENLIQQRKAEIYLQGLDDEIFAVLYLVATELRSVLIGTLFVNQKITAQEAFQLTFAEELEQQRRWGKDDVVKLRQKDIMDKLTELEAIINAGSLFKN